MGEIWESLHSLSEEGVPEERENRRWREKRGNHDFNRQKQICTTFARINNKNLRDPT